MQRALLNLTHFHRQSDWGFGKKDSKGRKKKKIPIKMPDEEEMLLIISWMIVP